MKLHHYSVTQLRAAAACPRIHWFDQRASQTRGSPVTTRIWVQGKTDEGAAGQLFHHAIDRFNRSAADVAALVSALELKESVEALKRTFLAHANQTCINHERLDGRSVQVQRAFIVAIHGYMEELAQLAYYGRSGGIDTHTLLEQLFGDPRRRVDATFHVSEDVQVHVTGAIDYVFYDHRLKRHRVIDYKLTPSQHPDKDLFQVCTYALMHHHQHGTRPDVAVYYLHPNRQIVELPWEQVEQRAHAVYDLLGSMVRWSNYQSGSPGLQPPGNRLQCAACRWDKKGLCEAVLGPKESGSHESRWQAERGGRSPLVEVRVPVRVAPGAGPSTTATTAESESGDWDEDGSTEGSSADDLVPDGELASWLAPPVPPDAATSVIETRKDDAPADGGMLLGRASSGAPVLLPPSVLRTHVAVVGAAGSGKSWLAKVIAEEAILSGIPVLAIDPQGDLVQFLRQRSSAEIPEEDRARYEAFLARVEPRVFTPGSSHGRRLSIDPLRLPKEQELSLISSPARRSEEAQGMLGATAASIVALCRAGGDDTAQRTFLFQLLQAMTGAQSVTLSLLAEAVSHPEDFGLDEPERFIKKAEREKLGRRLQAYVHGPAATLFQGGEPLDLDSMRRPTADGRIPLNVIYLNALTDDDQKQFFLATLAGEIYRWMVTSLDGTSERPTLLFYIDEARDFIPAGGALPAAKQPLIRLFTQGRKYGVSCLFCTQSPRSVDYNVFGNASTKLIGRMEAAQDVERIADWFTTSGPVPSWVVERKGAPRGSFVGRWPDMAPSFDGATFKSRTLFSAHEGAWSPDRVEREVAAAANPSRH